MNPSNRSGLVSVCKLFVSPTDRWAFLAGILATLLGRNTHAGVIYDNLGPDGVFTPHVAYTVSWSHLDASGLGVATSFRVGNMGWTLDALSFPLSQSESNANLAISIYEDTAGLPSSVMVERLAVNPVEFGLRPQTVTFLSSLHPVLQANTPYWVVLEPFVLNSTTETDNTMYWWPINAHYSEGPVAQRRYDFEANAWPTWNIQNSYLPAFRVEGTAVPEPGVVGLLVCGGLAWLLFRRRRLPPVLQR